MMINASDVNKLVKLFVVRIVVELFINHVYPMIGLEKVRNGYANFVTITLNRNVDTV